MNTLSPGIRNAVRALVRKDDQLLLLKKSGPPLGLRYALPGGAQDLGETLEQALIRECIEEINTPVEIIRLLHVADYYKQRSTQPPSTRQQLEFLFECRVPDDYQPASGSHPDKQQVDVVWVPLNDLPTTPLLPTAAIPILQQIGSGNYPCYLGLLK